MYLAYYDESGDDGYPKYSSPIFILTTCYLHYLHWKETHAAIHSFRKSLKASHGLPVRTEFHCKYFLLNKDPYRAFEFSGSDRAEIVSLFCNLASNLNIQFINVAIIKPRITKPDYEVLDMAFKYSIQRIENTLGSIQNPENKFLIITDPGRIGKMRKTSRRIQRINYIPSKYDGSLYRREIQGLIEDPLPKDSEQSYFIQLCDMVSYLVYLYCLVKTKSGSFSNRMPPEITMKVLEGWMKQLEPCLNTKASAVEYGIVVHPAKPTRQPRKRGRQ